MVDTCITIDADLFPHAWGENHHLHQAWILWELLITSLLQKKIFLLFNDVLITLVSSVGGSQAYLT